MARLIEMMKQSAVPAGVMRSASRGALAVATSEMLEILVYLSDHAIFGEQARMTLAGFDEAGSTAALADPNTPREVLHYFLAPRNRRPKLLPVLFENPSVSEEILGAIAETANREVLVMLLASRRVMSSPKILKPMVNNSHATLEEHEALTQKLASLGVDVGAELGTVTDTHVLDWLKEHAAELEAEEKEAKPFALMGGVDETAEESAEISAEALEAAKGKSTEQDERLSVLQKLARMKVSEIGRASCRERV